MFRPNDAEGGRTGGAGGVTSLRWGVERTASLAPMRPLQLPRRPRKSEGKGQPAPGRSRAQAASSLQEAESCCAGAPERGALVQMAMRAAGLTMRVAPRVRTPAVSAKPPTNLTATLSSADDQPTTAPADFVPGALFA